MVGCFFGEDVASRTFPVRVLRSLSPPGFHVSCRACGVACCARVPFPLPSPVRLLGKEKLGVLPCAEERERGVVMGARS